MVSLTVDAPLRCLAQIMDRILVYPVVTVLHSKSPIFDVQTAHALIICQVCNEENLLKITCLCCVGLC